MPADIVMHKDFTIQPVADAVRGVTSAGAGALRTVSRVTYATTYVAAYGIVFASLLIGKSLPLNNPVGHGLIDGGRAARDAMHSG